MDLILNRIYQIEGEPKNDLVLVRESGETGDVVVGRYLGIFADRVVVLRSDGDPQRVRWPVSGDPTDWLGDGSGSAIVPSWSDPIDELMALEPLTSNVAVLFRKASKARVLQTGQVNPALSFHPWIEELGTESSFSVISVPSGIMYFGSNKQVYFLTEAGDQAVGQRVYEEFLRSPVLDLVEAVYDPDDQNYILCMAQGEDEDELTQEIIEIVHVSDIITVNIPGSQDWSGFVFFSDAHSCTPVGDSQQSTNVRLIDFVFCDQPECGGPGGWRAWYSNDPNHHPDHPDNPLLPYK
jgi:hypothetical protein